mgnify:CR=1 FL=1
MGKVDDYVFVLWAERFDEAAAAVFVAELREAGLRVKLVSLSSRPAPGAHGLILAPDMTLEKAISLTSNAVCVVVPAVLPGINRLQDDPRVSDFLVKTRNNHAVLVTESTSAAALANLAGVSPSSNGVLAYSEAQGVQEFARQLASRLH